MRCDQASRLISHSQEAPLNKAERWALSFHLLICRMCRKYKKQLKLMRNILGRLAEPQVYEAVASFLLDEEQSRKLRGRISKKIRENLDSM
ncbi:MAG: anti-sigma factor family protein [Planctomycetota bacterium]